MKIKKMFLKLFMLLFACNTVLFADDTGIEELIKMGFTEKEAQEMASFLNSLTPEQIEDLETQGKKLEEDMKKQGVDPNDPDQMLNFLMQQGGVSEFPEKPLETPTLPTKIEEPQAPKIEINPLATTDARLLLDELLERIGSLRQKASSRSKLHHLEGRSSQELDDLVYYLNILTDPKLTPLLTSKEFAQLYTHIKSLHSDFSRYEPQIAGKVSFEDDVDDPYQVLGIDYTASKKDIESAFAELKNRYDPTVIEQNAAFKALPEKDKKRELKEADLAFSIILDAYDTLKDPKEKSLVDKQLKDRIAEKRRLAKSSTTAFDALVSTMSKAVYQWGMIKEIKSLLEKYAPEVKKKAEQYEAQRKAAEEAGKKESQRAGEATRRSLDEARRTTERLSRDEEPGERYWREFRSPDSRKPGFDIFGSSGSPFGSESKGSKDSGSAFDGGSKSSGGEKKPGKDEAKKGGKKEESEEGKKEDKGKKGDKEDKASSGGKKEKEEKRELSELEMTAMTHPTDLAKIEKALKADEKKDGTLPNLFKNKIPDYLAQDIQDRYRAELPNRVPQSQAQEKEILDGVQKFVADTNLFALAKDFQELKAMATDPKTEARKVKNLGVIWKSIYDKYKKPIDDLRTLVDRGTDTDVINTNVGAINPAQKRFHKLLNPTQDKEEFTSLRKKVISRAKEGEEEETPTPGKEGYLGFVKNAVDSIQENFAAISKKLGVGEKKDKK